MSPYTRLTIDDIARLAGVSRTTASMVLNGRAEQYRISAATQQRVLATAHEIAGNPISEVYAVRGGRASMYSFEWLGQGCSVPVALVLRLDPEAPRFIDAAERADLAGTPIPLVRLWPGGTELALKAELALKRYGAD